jgi:hypothetical protein
MRKGYIFMMDVVFASMVLLIGFMIITSTRPREDDEIPLPQMSDSILDTISKIRIRDICEDNCVCSIPAFDDPCTVGLLNNDSTIAQSLGQMYDAHISDEEIANVFIDVSNQLVREDIFNLDLIIDGRVIYSDSGKHESPEIITGKRMIFGYTEDKDLGSVTFWGPYVLEVNVWK